MRSAKTVKWLAEHASRRVLGGLLDAVCPRACLLCSRRELHDGDELCRSCREALQRLIDQPYCRRCGRALAPVVVDEAGCGWCRAQSLRYDGVIRLGPYVGELATALKQYKFRGRVEFEAFLVSELSRRIVRSEVYEEIDVITAVPTCLRHRLVRSFHPAVVLGKAMAKACGIPYAQLLRRRGGGKHQLGQPMSNRAQNVRGKFEARRRKRVAKSRVCLVDDVMTSGATAGECAKILKAAGATRVYVAIVARAGDDSVSLLQA